MFKKTKSQRQRQENGLLKIHHSHCVKKYLVVCTCIYSHYLGSNQVQKLSKYQEKLNLGILLIA